MDSGAPATDSGAPATDSSAPATDVMPPSPEDSGTATLDTPIPVDAFMADGPPQDAAGADLAAPDVGPEVAKVDLALDVANAPPPPKGTGLLGSYFDGTQLEDGTPGCLDLQRVDKEIDFDWPDTVTPGPNMDHDNFSVRWTGDLVPLVSGSYTFTTRTDDGVKLYLDGVLLLGNWTVVGATTQTSAPKTLVANQRYAIRLEYRETTKAAMAKLSWTPPMQASQIVAQEFLFPAPRYQNPLKSGCKPTPP